MDEKLRAAIVGFGKMGLLHGALINASGLAEVVAIVDRSPQILKGVERAFKGRLRALNSIEGLLDLDIDIVYITTPIPTHFTIALQTLKSMRICGIFVEKTLTDSSEKSYILARKVSGIINGVGYQKRFIPTFQLLKKLIEGDEIGAVERVRIYAYSQDMLGLKGKRFTTIASSRGGVLRDLGSHAIDLLLWLFNSRLPRVLDTRYTVSSESPCGEIVAELEFKDIEVDFATSWCRPGYRMPEVGIEIVGTRGNIFAVDDELVVRRDGEERKVYRAILSEDVGYLLASPEYFAENKAFLQSVVERKRFPGVTFSEAALIDEVIDNILVALYASSSR